jgi:hypothetical protein
MLSRLVTSAFVLLSAGMILAACPGNDDDVGGDDDDSATDDDDSATDDDDSADVMPEGCPDGWVLVEPPAGGVALLGQPTNGLLNEHGTYDTWLCDRIDTIPNTCVHPNLVERQPLAVPEPFCMPTHPFPGSGHPWGSSMGLAVSADMLRQCMWPVVFERFGALPPTTAEFVWAASGGADPATGEPRNLPYPYGDVWNLGRAPGAFDEEGVWSGPEPPCLRAPGEGPDRPIGGSPECCNPLGICETTSRCGATALPRDLCETEEAKYDWFYNDFIGVPTEMDLRCDDIGDRYATWRPEEVHVGFTGTANHRDVGFSTVGIDGMSFWDATHFGLHYHGEDNDAAPFDGWYLDDAGIWFVLYPGHWTQARVDALAQAMEEVVQAESWLVLWAGAPDLPEVCSIDPSELRTAPGH